MPGLPVRRRRTEEPEEEEDEQSSQSGDSHLNNAAPRPPATAKRARLSHNSPEHVDGDTSSLSDAPRSRLHGRANRAPNAPDEYQPGSIVRVKLQNFVTYTSAEFFPGPSLNMIIGPNGTGKSTLVCAICLGLGWGPQHLGRAKDVSEYVKHGCHEATIEIELTRRADDQEENPIIRRLIKREGNKSQFSINGKPSTLKSVLDLAKSFSIQIDNLCQFLPQDKVCEFAALTPIELLHSTQRAAAPEYMLEWHDHLKILRAEQKKVQAQQSTDKETLANLDGRQETLRADVERLQERAKIQKRVGMLEKALPFARYKEARNLNTEAKKKSKEAQVELRQLEDELEPSLRAVNNKQTYSQQIEKAVRDRKKVLERAEITADDMMGKQKEMEEKIRDFNYEIQAEKEGDKKRKSEIIRIDANIKRLEKQMSEVTLEFDPLVYNEQIREKQRKTRELTSNAQEQKNCASECVRLGREKNERIAEAQRRLENLDSQAGQQGAKLRGISSETAEAWDWIQANQNEFEHPVFGPPILECSVKDPRYVDAIESLFQKNDFLTFTTQSRNDFKKLGEQLYGKMKLGEINIRTSTIGLDQCRAPVSDEQMQRYGFEGWALDFIAGPAPVLAMLCGECRIHQTGVSLRDISQRQYEALQNSPISSWVTGKASFQITRRREYGPGATSTRVRDIKMGRYWTNQPVDMRAKRDLEMNIQGWTEEMQELTTKANEANGRLRKLREEVEVNEREKKEIEDEKAARQKAYGEFKALPTRLAQEQEKYASLDRAGGELKDRVAAIVEKISQSTLEKGRRAVAYAQHVAELEIAHEELLETEIMLIEAQSDVEVLTERNRSVKNTLELRRREVTEVMREAEETAAIGRRLLKQCQKILSDEGGEEQREFQASLPEDQSAEDLQTEIESEQARLELVHEGNPNAMTEYENRQRTIDKLRERVAKVEGKLEELNGTITEVRQKWEPELDELVQKISDAFAKSFEKIGCAGQVGIHKDDDFDHWAIQILVKFRHVPVSSFLWFLLTLFTYPYKRDTNDNQRENEPLTLLTSHRQSGGERAVSTIFYLLSLQSLARSPFRVVDEINQGMDPRNERVVHDRLLDIACNDEDGGGSQYFLITPKLLHGLRYHPRMRVLCIASGEYMPDAINTTTTGGRKAKGKNGVGGLLDFAGLADRRRTLKAGLVR